MTFLRNFATVGSFTLLSRFLGFVRELITAVLLGAGPVADAFVVAQRLPNLFRGIFAEGAMDAAFIPIYARKLRFEGAEAAGKFSNQILTIMLLVLAPFTAVALLCMPVIVSLLVPGFSAEGMRFDLGVLYCSITFGYIFLISVTALQGGILNAHGRFAPFAAAPVLMNVIMIGVMLVTAGLGGDMALAGCWALIGGGFVQFVLLWFYCRRAGVVLSLIWPKWTKDIKQFFKLVGPGSATHATAQLGGFVATVLSSSLPPGAVAALFYSDRLLQFPIGVTGIAIATALLPPLASHIAVQEKAKATYYFSRAMEVAVAFSLPLFLILQFEAASIVRVLFQHGAFTSEDARTTAECLMGYAAMIPGFVFIRIMMVSFFASEDSRTPLIIAFICLAVNIIGSLLLRPYWAHIGIAVGFTFSVWVNVALLAAMLLRRGAVELDGRAKKRMLRFAFSGMALLLAFDALNRIHTESWVTFLPTLFLQTGFVLSLKLLAGGFVYIAAVHLTGALRFDEMKRLLKSTKNPTEMDESGI